jgi:predicted amidohydrolase YtcJ
LLGYVEVSFPKQFVDGITQTHTGYLLEPYHDKSDTSGAPNYAPELYKECIVNANKEGFGVRLHCAGDAAVRLALDAFEKSCKENDNSNIRNCIEHIENIHPDDIPRFATLGVIASMQPLHLPMEPLKVTHFGEERAQYEWTIKTLLDNGATLAFGTDYPASDLNPFVNIYTAVTRCNQDGTPAGEILKSKFLWLQHYGPIPMEARVPSTGRLKSGHWRRESLRI